MANNTRSMNYVVTGDVSKFQAAFRKAAQAANLSVMSVSASTEKLSKATDHHTSRMGRSLSGWSSAVKSACSIASKAMLPVAAAFTAGAFQGVKYAASLEQSQMAFTTMLGSAGKAQSFLRDLQQFAATTPFNMPDVIKSSQQLMAFGFQAGQVIPMLTAVGDAASGLGIGSEGIERITIAIGQMQAKTRVQSDELLQLTENGVPALRILANQYGVSAAKMQEMVTAGAVSADKAIPLLLKGMEKGTKGAAGMTTAFGGMMRNQSSTLTGIWSNFVDTANIKLAQLVQPAIPYIKKGISWLTDVMSGNGPLGSVLAGVRDRAKEAFTAALPAIRELASDVGKVALPVMKSWGEYVINTIGPMVSGVFSAIAGILKTYAPLFKDIGHWVSTAVFPVLADVGKLFTNTIVPIVARFFKAALPGFRDLFGALKSAWGSVVILWNALKPIVGPILVVALAAIVAGFRAIAWALDKVVAPALRGLARLLAGTITVITDVLKWFGRLPGQITSVFRSAGTWLYQAGKDVIQGFWDGLTFIWKKVTGWVSGLATWIKDHKGPISLDRKLLEPAGRALMEGLGVGLMGGFVKIKDIVSGAAGTIGGYLGGMSVSVAGQFKDALSYASALVHAMYGQARGNAEFAALKALWNGESGWNPNAVNPSSGAYGIPQALPAAQGHPYALGDWASQIRWGLQYIKGRYGDPIRAYSAWVSRNPHWYASGTLSAARGWGWVGERGPELMWFNGGERVIANRDTPASAGTVVNNNVYVTVQGHVLSNKQELARQVSDALVYGQAHGVNVPWPKR